MELIHYYEDLNTLHVGTEKPRCYYLPKKTDGTTYVDAELSDGTMCRIHIETAEGFPHTIDGVDEHEYFESIPYAG